VKQDLVIRPFLTEFRKLTRNLVTWASRGDAGVVGCKPVNGGIVMKKWSSSSSPLAADGFRKCIYRHKCTLAMFMK
jgi:hypothetical protein